MGKWLFVFLLSIIRGCFAIGADPLSLQVNEHVFMGSGCIGTMVWHC
jgi:hypothetical protein